MTQLPERPLDLAGQAPDIGRVSIKASAGTGKTYSLTVLAVQHVAEHDIRPDQLLMVTYTREATSELRAKTRERAQEALDALRSDKSFETSSWMHRMAESSVRHVSIERLSNFLARFDEVTVSTIHGFCQNVLRRGGLRSPASMDFSVVPNIDHIIDQVMTDHLLEILAANPAAFSQLSTDSAVITKDGVTSNINAIREAVKRVLGNQGSVILPQAHGPLASAAPESGDEKQQNSLQLALKISELVTTLVDLVHERCKRDNIITYDDLVRLVSSALHPSPSDFVGDELAERQHSAQQLGASIAEQYKVIMVDEFQDTDAAQWSIFRAIFKAGSGTLITVGDPKQAIYRFRGADVNVYLDAVSDALYKYVLDTNRRSDKPLLDAVETLLSGQTFDTKGTVAFDHVECDPDKRTGYFSPSLEIRYVGAHKTFGATEKKAKKTKKSKKSPDVEEEAVKPELSGNDPGAVLHHFMTDMANEVSSLLSSNIEIPDKHSAEKGATRPLRPKDIAVLVHAHEDARKAVEALKRVNIPAIRLKTESVFGTPAAMQWLMLLAAIAQPVKPTVVRAYGLSWFGGRQIPDLVGTHDELLAQLQRECAQLGSDLRRIGITGLYLKFRNDAEFLQRILSMPDGERIITDLDHIAEILAAHPRIVAHAGASECHEILVELVNDLDAESDEQKRRIETDEDSVVVMTMHTSKGLQFPIVFLPTAHKNPNNMGNNPLMFPFNFGQGTARVIDVASGFDNAKNWLFLSDIDTESDGDDVSDIRVYDKKSGSSRKGIAAADAREDRRRLLYVALTRAEHKLVTYFSPLGAYKPNLKEPWAEVLARAASPELTVLPDAGEELDEAMNNIAQRSVNSDKITTIEVVPLPLTSPTPRMWSPTPSTSTTSTSTSLATASFDRDPTTLSVNGFQRWSYSGITRLVTGEKNASPVDATAFIGDVSEPEIPSGKYAGDENNEPVYSPLKITAVDGLSNTASAMPMATLPGSAALGNLVHELLDSLDPTGPSLEDRVRADVDHRLTMWRSKLDAEQLTRGLIAAMNTPVAPMTSDTVVSLGRTHRLSEMSFDFCLPQSQSFALADIGAALLLDNGLPAEFKTYANELTNEAFQDVSIAGYMTGSIDAVFRISVDGSQKFLVSDYKTNKLHANDDVEPLVAYHPENLAAAMVKDGYVLQALIYTVALQRYLRSRIPNYDYETHIAGVSYLFLRGMIGKTTDSGAPYGVFFWRPQQATVDALDSLFAGSEL